MKVRGEVTGVKEVNVRIIGMPDRVREELRQEMSRIVDSLATHVQRDYLSGQVLQARTGKLRASIAGRVENGPGGAVVGVVGSRGVPYARIQHDGGRTAPHVIMPKTARVLHFFGSRDGLELFLAKVDHPGSNIKGTFYLNRALFDYRQMIITDLFAAVMRGTK